MANWNSLPPETRDHILRLFCEDVVSTYNRLGSPQNIDCLKHPLNETRLRWPQIPSCLRDISSAKRVCRYFYHSIVHYVRTYRASPTEHLESIQCNKVFEIALYFNALPATDRRVAHIGLFMDFAGVFWKNQQILGDSQINLEVLNVLQKASVMMFLPHLKDWIYAWAKVDTGEDDAGYARYDLPSTKCSGDTIVFELGARGSYSLQDESGDVFMFTTKGLYRGFQAAKDDANDAENTTSDEDFARLQESANIKLRARYPILRRMEDADARRWWVVELCRFSPDRWFLVNFKERIFWHHYLGNTVCVWNKADGAWRPEEWALVDCSSKDGSRRRISEVLKSVGYGEEGEVVDGAQSGIWEHEESGTREDDDDGFEPESVDGEGNDIVRDGESKLIDHSDALFKALSRAFE